MADNKVDRQTHTHRVQSPLLLESRLSLDWIMLQVVLDVPLSSTTLPAFYPLAGRSKQPMKRSENPFTTSSDLEVLVTAARPMKSRFLTVAQEVQPEFPIPHASHLLYLNLSQVWWLTTRMSVSCDPCLKKKNASS